MIVIAIAGGTASGKTTLSNKIVEHYKNFNVKYLSLDSYYKDFSNLSFSERSKINFDDPESLDFDFFYQQINEYLNGSIIKTPCYSYKSHKRLKKTLLLRQGDLLILDGILILLKKSIRDFFDLSIFLNVDSSERLRRRVERDTNERGRSEIEINDRFYKMIKPMHEKYVRPSEKFADVVIGENYDYELIKIKIDQLLNGNHQKN